MTFSDNWMTQQNLFTESPVQDTSRVSNISSSNSSNSNSTVVQMLTTAASRRVQGGCVNDDLNSGTTVALVALTMGVTMMSENLLMFTVIVRTRSLHNNTNILVASLALTDLLVGLEACVMGMTGLPNGGLRAWLGLRMSHTRVFDSLLTGFNYGLISVSMCHFAVLAVDRYLYVLWPLHYALRVKRRCMIVTACALWTLGLVYMLLPVMLFTSPGYHEDCLIFNSPVEYGEGPMLILYFLCLCVVLASTVGLARIALRHTRRSKRNMLGGLRRLSGQLSTANSETRKESAKTGINRSAGHESVDNSFKGSAVMERSTPANVISPALSSTLSHTDNEIVFYLSFRGIDIKTGSNTGQKANSSRTISQTDNELCDDIGSNKSQEMHIPNNPVNDSTRNNDCQIRRAATTTGDPASVDQAKTVVEMSSAPDQFDHRKLLNAHKKTPTAADVNTSIPPSVSTTALKSVRGDVSRVPRDSADPSKRESTLRLFSRENVKIIKFVMVMFGCFLLCTFPPLITFFLDGRKALPTFSHSAVRAMYVILASNSGMNFLIITYMNSEFREALVKTLHCARCCCTRTQENTRR